MNIKKFFLLFLFLFSSAFANTPSAIVNKIEIKTIDFKFESLQPPFYSDFCKTEDAIEIANSIRENCGLYGIPVYIAYTLIETESGGSIGDPLGFYKTTAKSSANCLGLTQVSKYALKEFNDHTGFSYTMEDMKTVNKNIKVGLWYFKYLKNKLNLDRWDYVYIAYNVGLTEYKKLSKYNFYEKGKMKGPYYHSWFYKQGLFPPNKDGLELTGKSFAKYNPLKRFRYFESQYQNMYQLIAMN